MDQLTKIEGTTNGHAPAVPFVERVEVDGRLAALIVRASFLPSQTTFLTPDDLGLQVGLVSYPANGAVPRHRHKRQVRRVNMTCEALFVRRGRAILDLYDDAGALAAERELGPGDTVLLTGGGHGVRMLADTVLLEVKQGPYLGLEDKERF
jgi:hypothetical protein